MIYNTSYIFAENSSKYNQYLNALRIQIFFGLTSVYNIGYPRFELLSSNSTCFTKKSIVNILWTPRWTFDNNSIDKSSFLDYFELFIDYFKKNKNINLHVDLIH